MKPILYNTEMVRAILAGRKTQTRRLIKAGDHAILHGGTFLGSPDGPKYGVELDNHGVIVAPYQKGDVLYVRETWMEYAGKGDYIYFADMDDIDLASLKHAGFRWHPSIHMPKAAARIFLRVTDVRAERLQEITAEGARSEGIRCYNVGMGEVAYSAAQSYEDAGNVFFEDPVGAFATLWVNTIKIADLPRYGWAANPWVGVICFERCEKPGG